MKGCPGCGGKELTEHVSGITQEVHYDNGYIVREVTLYPKSYKAVMFHATNAARNLKDRTNFDLKFLYPSINPVSHSELVTF